MAQRAHNHFMGVGAAVRGPSESASRPHKVRSALKHSVDIFIFDETCSGESSTNNLVLNPVTLPYLFTISPANSWLEFCVDDA